MEKRRLIFTNPQTFQVPVCIVDKYLKAPEDALRLILFLLRNSNTSFSVDDMCKATGIPENRIDELFMYWMSEGVLCRTPDGYSIERPKIAASDIVNYTPDEIASRMNSDEGIRSLMSKAEMYSSKVLTTTDASLILSVVDWIGLPPEVALMLMEYCRQIGQSTLRQYQKKAVEWMDNGITTIDAAEDYLASQKRKTDLLTRISEMVGASGRALGEKERATFVKWSEEYGYGMEIIHYAYECMIDSKGFYKYQYMDAILKTWHDKNLLNLKDISDYNEKNKTAVKQTNQRQKAYSNKVTTDTDSAKKSSWDIVSSTIEEGNGENNSNEQ